MSGKKYLIVGAGISGAAIARLAAAKEPGSRITVIDRKDRIAGNCYDHIEDGIDVHDYGSHILHTDDAEVWHFLSHFSDFNTYMHRVKAVVDGMEVPVPFNLDSIRICFPPTLANEIEKKLLKTYGFGTRIPVSDLMKTDDPDLKRLAQYVYENIYVHYTAKQWGKDPSELDSAVTARVPVAVSRDPRYFYDRYQGIPVGAFNDTRRGTVLGGYSAMVRNMLDMPNIDVRLGTPFDPDMAEGYSRIFYTGPADELMGYEFGRLPYRSERFEFETHMREHCLDNAVVNYPNNYDFTRIHEFKYYLGTKSQTTITAKEYPEEYVPGRNEPYYPIPSPENEALHRKYAEAAAERFPNLKLLGRLGDYRYYNMDAAVARAIAVYREEFGPELPAVKDRKSSRQAGRKTPTVMYLGY